LKEIGSGVYELLAWEPSVTQVTLSYSRRLPELGSKLRFKLFSSIKVDSLYLESQNQAKNIPVALPSSKKIFLDKLV